MGKVRLTDLDPRWGAENGNRYCLIFACPIEGCPNKYISVPFKMFEGYDPKKHHIWTKTGDDFDTISLAPSVDATRTKQGEATGCLFHGFVTNGEVTW